ncbi:hypothetical protein [Ancylobacter mangrovi]|uniref:hypothetical protein n=1 Tax=Ancylobacter mangrovi TaxID=2972472 RepID=UPI0021633F14|nr:hypothetical protein [Ancylobacter mangrovi]MCS0503068.1 hypothetical protein [Ancylobacter mangrovi]
MNVTEHIGAAFALAAQRQEAIRQRWRAVAMIGYRLPRSLLPVAIQRIGELDVLLRCMEDDIADAIRHDIDVGSGEDHALHLAEMWVGSAYEVVRVVNERVAVEKTDAFKAVFRDLGVLRMPMEKHELEGGKRTGVLKVGPVNEHGVPERVETYDPADPERTFIMQIGLSLRGSAMWEPYDYRIGGVRRIERRQIADAMLDLWAPIPP